MDGDTVRSARWTGWRASRRTAAGPRPPASRRRRCQLPCSTISTLVFLTSAPTVSQSRDARSRKLRSISSASMLVRLIASAACATIDRYVSTVTSDPARRTAALPKGIW